jgi:hypothetical protein
MTDFQQDIRIGTKLLVNPGVGSHTQEPYHVEVIAFDDLGFTTKLLGKNPSTMCEAHERRFNYRSIEWITYHYKRFELL